MLCLSFYEWKCIYRGEQMILTPFLEKSSLERAPGQFADYLFVPKHLKADVLLTTISGPLRFSPGRRGRTRRWPHSPPWRSRIRTATGEGRLATTGQMTRAVTLVAVILLTICWERRAYTLRWTFC